MKSNYKEINGDLIQLTMTGIFDVIAHGVNCFCTQGAGIAPQMVKAFGTDKTNFESEIDYKKGDIGKLGNIESCAFHFQEDGSIYADQYETEDKVADFHVVNCYTQYKYGRNHADGVQTPIDYEALTLCMRKINHKFKGRHIGLPGLIGCGLAGGNPEIVKAIIKKELKDCEVTIVYLNP